MSAVALFRRQETRCAPMPMPSLDERGQAVWQGDSMEPTISPGDIITVDMSVRTFGQDGIYAIGFDDWLGRGFMLRRLILRPLDDLIDVVCDNPRCRRHTETRDTINSLNILGLVVESWARRSHV